MNKPIINCLSALLTVFTVQVANAGNWPGWRGPDGTGISTDKNLPLTWGTNQNVRWRVDLPGPGNSSPIVWGNRVFVTQAVKGDNRRTLMCFDRADGKLLWQSGVTYTEPEPTQESNPYCPATPVTDGQRIMALFGSAGLYCYDFDGKELWRRDLGKMNHMFGNGASPILTGDLCVINFGPDEKARLIAVNKQDGKTAWEVLPPKIDPSEQKTMVGGPGGPGGPGAAPGGGTNGPGGPGVRGPGGPGKPGGPPSGTWSTPILIKAGDREELIMGFPNRLAAYEPKTGNPLWFSKGLGDSIYTTPLWGDGIIFAMAGGPGGGPGIAVKPGGNGDVTESQRLWRIERARSAIGSGVIHDGHLYLIAQDGTIQCVDAKTGKTVGEKRLKGPGSKSITWSSMIITEGRIYIPNQSGDVFVLRAIPDLEVIATNSVHENTNASLAAADQDIILRTDLSLWCFTNTK